MARPRLTWKTACGICFTNAATWACGWRLPKTGKFGPTVQEEPVLKLGPGDYDSEQIALNQVIKYQGRYYAYYHGSGHTSKPRLWCPAIATSTDLIHWQKYPGNPLRPMKENRSSGIVVPDGDQFRFYTMHDKSICSCR